MNKLKREYLLSPVEFVKYQLHDAINRPTPNMNETDLTVLAYVHLYGKEARAKLYADRIFTSPTSISNYISKLKTMGYIFKDEDEDKLGLNPDIHLQEDSYLQIVIVNLNKDSDKVNHPYYKEKTKDK